MSEAVLDVGALDASAAAVESEVPALETETSTPVVDTPAADTETKAGEESTEKPAPDTAVTAPIDNKTIVAQLQEWKKTNEPLAKAIYNEVKSSQDAKRFLKENGAKDFAELKAKLSTDEVTENFRSNVEQTDALLYHGDLKELTSNILEDIKAELGDAAPARLSELGESILDAVKTADPAGHTRIVRSAFLDASEQSGLISGLNTLAEHLASGDVRSATSLLKSIGKFFSEEIKANQDGAKARTEHQATQTKATTEAVTALRNDTTAKVNSLSNNLMGAALKPFLQKELKGMSRPQLEDLAREALKDLHLRLGRDNAYRTEMSQKYESMKSPAQQREMLKIYEAKLKSGDFAKRVVEENAKRMFPDRFKAAPAATAAPASKQALIGGKNHTVFQLSKRPANLIRTDTQVGNRLYTVKDLELLQLSKGIGLAPSKTGKPVFVQWTR
jgi:hypothetical protein